jgi:TonB family protein
MVIHEFEADEQAGVDKETYSKILLATHFESKQLYLLQNFFHHPLKRRIMMLYKNRTSDKGRKALLLTFSVLTLAAVMILQSNTVIAQGKKTTETSKEEVFDRVDQVPEFPGGLDSLMKYLSRNIQYPEAAKKKNIEGRVEVQFVVDKKGNVRDAIILKDVPMGCGEEAKRVVLSMPKWKPGVQKGEKVSVYYTLPITFKLNK